MTTESPTRPPEILTERDRNFCREILAGRTQEQSYKAAFRYAGKNGKQLAKRVLAKAAVKELLERVRAQSDRKALLTVNDRLAICAEIAQSPFCKPSDRVMGVRVYNETAGDHAPERQEVTVKGDASAPLTLVTRPATKAEKIAALKAQQDAATAAAQTKTTAA